jgi:superfamily II DNA or RNA helicase
MALQDREFKTSLLSSQDNLAEKFLSVCFEESISYDRVAAYFSSSLFHLLSSSMEVFFQNGGQMRLVCSPFMSGEDAAAIKNVGSTESPLEVFSSGWAKLRSENPIFDLPSRLLSALVASGLLEVRIAEVKRGIYHDKLGLFYSTDGSAISFTGSANETYSAWSGRNHERIDIYCSWKKNDEERFMEHQRQFDQVWNGELPGVEIYAGEQVRQIVTESSEAEDWREVYKQIKQKRDAEASDESTIALRDYQKQAIASWLEADCRGIVAFATGGGKTLTAIAAMERWFKKNNSNTAVVLAPTKILCRQWVAELRKHYGAGEILEAHSEGVRGWKNLVADFMAPVRTPSQKAILVTTYDSVKSNAIKNELSQYEKFLLVGDEVHKFGSPRNRLLASWLKPEARIGLSATPLRPYDDEGTDAIWDFWGDQLEPVYELEQAIADGNLCPYEFDFIEYSLTGTEQEDWDSATREIGVLVARMMQSIGAERRRLKEQIDQLSIARAKILKGSESKFPLAAQIVSENYEDGDRWLIYCEDLEHLDRMEHAIREISPSLVLMQYHSQNEESHSQIFDYFTSTGGIILAIRCLDEGVDIPLINKAIIVSSSTSQREFIQRRGRILRNAPGKVKSSLWDFFTLNQNGCTLYQKEKDRLLVFAKGAKNSVSFHRLNSRIC